MNTTIIIGFILIVIINTILFIFLRRRVLSKHGITHTADIYKNDEMTRKVYRDLLKTLPIRIAVFLVTFFILILVLVLKYYNAP